MVYKIVCPRQQADEFDLAACVSCPKFQITIGKATTISCRENRQPSHKREFEAAHLSWRLGLPDTVEVEAEREQKRKT